jgi:hypothetical protein
MTEDRRLRLTDDEKRLLLIDSLYDLIRLDVRRLAREGIDWRLSAIVRHADEIIQHLDSVTEWSEEKAHQPGA